MKHTCTYLIAAATLTALGLGFAFWPAPKTQAVSIAATPVAQPTAPRGTEGLRYVWRTDRLYRYRLRYGTSGRHPAGTAQAAELNGELTIRPLGHDDSLQVLAVEFRRDPSASEPGKDCEAMVQVASDGAIHGIDGLDDAPEGLRQSVRDLLLETQVALGSGGHWSAQRRTGRGLACELYTRRGQIGDAVAIQRVRNDYCELDHALAHGVADTRVEGRHHILLASAGHLLELHGSERLLGIDREGETTLEIHTELALELSAVEAVELAASEDS